MKLTINIPDAMNESLQQLLGQDISQAAKEVLAIAWYRDEKLSVGQVAELLGITVYEAEGFLKTHQVVAPYSVEDFEHDRETLDRLLNS